MYTHKLEMNKREKIKHFKIILWIVMLLLSLLQLFNNMFNITIMLSLVLSIIEQKGCSTFCTVY